MKGLRLVSFCFALIAGVSSAWAHALPDAKAKVVIEQRRAVIHFQTPIEVLDLATQSPFDLSTERGVNRLKEYFIQHVQITDSLKSEWRISVVNVRSGIGNDRAIGAFPEALIDLSLEPSRAESLKKFSLSCDWIIHQIPNQSIFFSIEKDEQVKELGVVAWTPSGTILPIQIRSTQSNTAARLFVNMLKLGIAHIREGSDHILFLLTLLLPACLAVRNRRWVEASSVKSGILQLGKVTAAFTLGHSITLLASAVKLISIPAQAVEIFVALTILISAVHAVRPIFYQREVVLALLFGFIHGMAFSETLREFQLTTGQLLVSVLGFNLGIELMQVLVITLVMPWIILLSRAPGFSYFQYAYGAAVGVAVVGWLAQHISGEKNGISQVVETLFENATTLIAVLIIMSLAWYASSSRLFGDRVRVNRSQEG